MRLRPRIFKKSPVYVALIAGALVMIFPFIWMISSSLKPNLYVIEYPPQLIPSNPSLENFLEAWNANNFQQYFRNSAFVAITSTLLSVTISAMAAYAFARFKFPGQETTFYVLLGVLMVPNIIVIVPQFFLMKFLGLRNSLWGLVLIYTATSLSLNTFLLRGFFEQLPHELEEAVLIDGGSYLTIFANVILPLSTPALATVSIFSFMGFWDEFVMALTFIDDPAKRTLPIAIALFQGQHGTQWGLVFAASLIALIPIFIFFFGLQKYFVGGLTTGAFKG
ncbi:MAG: carbohydrate ABC transporter permease [Chloroflexi bacterium]|nr:carbohydrate ABC transporter permease [Chloroflexota bacterium]